MRSRGKKEHSLTRNLAILRPPSLPAPRSNKPHNQPETECEVSPEDRKARSEALLKERGIPFLDSLPCVESEEEASTQAVEEVGKRIICLFCVSGTGFEPDDSAFIDYLKENDFWQYLSRQEATFLSNPQGHEQAQIKASWQMEALYFLLWAVKVVPELPFPIDQSSSNEFIESIPKCDESPWPFIRSLQLRPLPEILDASDLIYRLHWATRHYGKKVNVNQEVVQEWHHAVNWLTNYDGEGWDWVATDT